MSGAAVFQLLTGRTPNVPQACAVHCPHNCIGGPARRDLLGGVVLLLAYMFWWKENFEVKPRCLREIKAHGSSSLMYKRYKL